MAKPLVGKRPKAPKAEVTQTPELIFRKNFQDAYLEGRSNPALFARHFLDFDPYSGKDGFGQEDFLIKWLPTVEAIFNGGNRVGKSFLAGLCLLHKAFYRHYSPYYTDAKRSAFAPYLAMATSLTQSQANLAFDYAVQFAENSKRFRPFMNGEPIYSPHANMEIRTILENGESGISTIAARSLAKRGTYLLGQSISFILVDETAFIPGFTEIQDTVLRARLADQGGSLLKISSPNGHNHFFEEFIKWWNGNQYPIVRGSTAYQYLAYRLTTHDNPWVPRSVLEEISARMVPELYQQNIMAEFVTLSDFFSGDAIKKLYTDGTHSAIEIDPETPGAPFPTFPVEPTPNGRYAMGVDLGFKRDPTVVYIKDLETGRVVFVRELKHATPPTVRQAIVATYRNYHPVRTAIDSTGVGMTFVQALVEEEGMEDVEQFVFTSQSKIDILTRLQDAVYQRNFYFPFCPLTRKTIDELSFYRLDDKNIKQDHVMALALMNYAAEEALKRTKIYTEIDDALMVTPVSYDNRYAYDATMEEGGVVFHYDTELGIFVPDMGHYGGLL